ncbi:MAG: VOC family protein [Terracidiphilus sp.]|jgi:PhnB protein
MKLTTHLNYGGNCAEALRFYEEHLGAKITFMMTYDQMPEPKSIPPGCEQGILHASIRIADTTIMACDAPGDRFQPMRSAYLALSLDSTEEAERAYALLSNGGEIFMPMGETFFAFRFAQLRDRFGTLWMLIHERPMPAAA